MTRSSPFHLIKATLPILLAVRSNNAWADSSDVSSSPPSEASPHEPSADRPSGTEPDHLRIGAFGGIGFPRPLSIEGMVKLEKLVGLGVEYSVLPKQSISGVDVTFWAVAADARLFPFQNGFFLGLAAGHQHLGAATSTTLTGPIEAAEETWFINPRLGFLTTLAWGLTLGIDAGVQIPISATLASTLPPQVTANQDVNSIARYLGETPVPTINLLRLGFML